MALGVILFLKGISFITNTQYLADLLSPIERIGGGMIVLHYVASAHILGGILIFFGLLTK